MIKTFPFGPERSVPINVQSSPTESIEHNFSDGDRKNSQLEDVETPTKKLSVVGDVDLWKQELVRRSAEAFNQIDDDEDMQDQLLAQVEHYKGILQETEGMLHQLHSKVQTKESRWKSRLAEKEAQLNRVFGEEDKLAKNIAAMIESLDEMETSDDNVEENVEGIERKLHLSITR